MKSASAPSFPRLAARPRRIVVKIGSSLLTKDMRIHRGSVAKFVKLVARLREEAEVALVTSGAVASADLPAAEGLALAGKQARAAVGQVHLMEMYRREFAKHGTGVGQVLLSEYLVKHRPSYLNARNTLLALFQLGIVPVINENDVMSVEELKFGDNDALGAIVAGLLDADLYVILSDVEGLYENFGKPDARLLTEVRKIDASIERQAGGSGSSVGTGGMASKIRAAKMAARFSVPVLITSGRAKDLWSSVVEKMQGTLFSGAAAKAKGRKTWIASALHLRARIVVDKGAEEALAKKESSLLASGIVEVKGDFHAGEVVAVIGASGAEIARGQVAFSSYELKRIRGRKSGDFAGILGRKVPAEVIHRNQLVKT